MVTRRPYPTHSARRAVVALSTLARARGRFVRVVVTGDSMQPGFADGDRLLVARSGSGKPGQVVALRDPRRPDRLLVKRVRSTGPAGIEVRGDNEAASTDSRHFGPVPRDGVIGPVIYRYLPPARAGWWPN